MTEHERTRCAALAALLHAGGNLMGGWGFALSAIAAAVLALMVADLGFTATLAFSATLLLGLPERYFAFRLRFDERLYQGLANGHVASLQSLDLALLCLGQPVAPAMERGLDERVLATRLLMRRHLIVVACQSIMFGLAIATETLA